MAENDFRFDAVAGLKQPESEKQVKKDIKSFLSNIKIPLIGTLSSKTRAQLKKDIADLNGTVNLTGKIESKGVVTSLQQATAQAQKQADSKPVKMSFSVKKDKLLNDIKLLARQNSKLFKDSDMTIKYNSLLDNAELAKNTVELSALRTQLGSFRSELKVTGNAGLTMTDALKNGLYKVFQLFGSHGIIVQFTAQLRKAWTEAKELDKSMTDLSRVNAEITRSGFPDYLDKVISKTKQLAVATKDYIDAVTTFSRAGYNLADSETLADMAVQLEKVGDMSAVDASKALLAGLQGYNEIDGYGMDQLTEKAQALNDKIDLIGNTASITQAELSQGIQAVGSVMNDANTSVDEFLALLGAGNRAVQDSDKVALAIRTSALRIRGCTSELQEMGEETDNVVESTSKLAEKIKALTNIDGSGGVNILEADEETFRSIYAIYNDIAKVYDKMSDKDASALLDLIAGKNRSNQISAILQNMSEANELLESSLSAAGTASEEYQIYLDSAEAATEIFGVAMTETYSSIISGDTVKGLANAGAAVLDFANSWNILEGTIRGFLTLGILKGVTTLTVAFKNSALQISNYGSALNAVKQVSSLAKDTTEYADAMKTLISSCVNLTDAQLKQVLANRNLRESQLIEILQLKGLEAEQRNARLSQLGLTQATVEQTTANGAATASTFSLKSAITGLGATIRTAWMTNPIGIIIMGISMAIGVATSAISKYNQQLEETRRANIESATTAAENADKLKDLYNEYTRLASIQDRTTSEEEAFKTAVENITVALGDKAEILKDLTAGTDEYADALARATKEELQSQAVTATIGRKSAEEDLQGDIWSKWSGSQVTIDSNSKGKALSDEAQKAVDIVSESLKEFETVNRTWKNISWDISSDDPTEALEYYNSLVEAREKLVLASENDEALLDTEIYEDLNTAINSMSESLDTYIEKLYEEQKLNYMAQNGIPSVTEEYKAMESTLVSAAGSSIDLQNKFKELLTSDFSDLATDIGNVASAVNDVNAQTQSIAPTISSSIQQIATQLEPQFAKLGESYKEIFQFDDNGQEIFSLDSIDNSMLEELRQTFADIKEEIGVTFDASKLDSFFDTLTNGNSTAEQVQQAFNDLATAYLYSTDTLEQLNSETANAIEKQLEEMGVQNAAEIVADELKAKTEELIVAKEYLAQTGTELASATDDEVTAFILEQIEAGNCGEALALLQLKKMLVNGTLLDTTSDINNVLALAQAAGITSDALTRLASLKAAFDNAQASGNYGAMNAISAEMQKAKAQVETDIANFKPVEIQFDSTSAAKSAAKAGKSAAESYTSAFQKELQEWKDLESQGKISHKQYLDALLRLVKKYFGDRKKYAKEYAQYMNEYLKGYLDLYNSALSGISTLLNQKISAANDAKDAAISALEEEKEAAAEAYQAQIDAIEEEKDAIDEEIKQKEKKIDILNEEAEAIKKASEARKRDIELQDAQWRKAQAENQRVELKYSQDKGFYYDVNTEEIRKANEDITEIQEEMQIAEIEKRVDLIQKEIDLLEEKKDALTEEQESIQKMLDGSNKFYDNLIKQQEKMWDSMIKGMEQQKSKWEELADIQQIAEAFSAVQQVFGELGYSVEDVLNGSEAAFEDFKSKYISLISDVNSNSDFTDGLVYATGVAKENLGSFLDKTKETSDGIDNLAAKGTELNTVAEGMNGLATSASDANTNISETATNVGNVVSNVDTLKTNLTDVNTLVTDEQTAFSNLLQTINDVIEAINQKTTAIQEEQNAVGIATSSEMADFLLLKEKILEVKETLDTISGTVDTLDTTPVDNLTESFQSLYEKILLVSTTLGTGIEGQGEGITNSITSAIQALNEISFDEGIIAQFTNLKTAIDSVSSAISGGGGESSGGESQSGNSGSGKGGESGGKGSTGDDGGNSLTGAITSMGETANKIIGEPDAEGDGTVIGEFGAMETAVNDVAAAIGGGDSESGGGQDKSESDSNNLIGSIVDLGETTEETLGEPDGDGVIGRFGEFTDVVAEANEQVQGISDGLAAIDGQTVECTIKVNIETTGGIPAYASGTALGTMNLESSEYNAKYEGNAHVSGTANVTGNWGVRKPGKSLVGELGQEIWVHSADGTFETVGDNGPEWINTAKGDLIFNHLQTKELLDKGNIVKTGKAYANGTVQYSDGTTILPDGSTLRPLQPGDKMYDMVQKFDAYFKSMDGNLEKLVPNSYYEHQRQMEDMAKQINYVSSVTNNNRNMQPVVNHINVTCPGVTSQQVAEQLGGVIGKELDKKFNGFSNWTDQMSRRR